ncbi:MAG TPA: hypothetical protein VMB50_06415 [Myxococcales bacterium]|nr:hypothetical protein [Myxococcales bacterium]
MPGPEDGSPIRTPPPPRESPLPAQAPAGKPLKRHVRSFWRNVVRLNQGRSSINRASGGALWFQTGVKLVAYAGLCLIVFILIHKVKEIEAQLDPISHGLSQLQGQLQAAESDMGRDTQASQHELVNLQERARDLKDQLDQASEQHQKVGAKSLAEADEEARDLADTLTRDATAAKAMDAQRDAAAQALADFAKALQAAKGQLSSEAAGLADGGAVATSALAALRAATQAQQDALAKQQDALAKQQLTAKLAKAADGADALLDQEKALGQRLQSAGQRLAKLEAALPDPASLRPPHREGKGAESPKLAAGRRAAQ